MSNPNCAQIKLCAQIKQVNQTFGPFFYVQFTYFMQESLNEVCKSKHCKKYTLPKLVSCSHLETFNFISHLSLLLLKDQ